MCPVCRMLQHPANRTHKGKEAIIISIYGQGNKSCSNNKAYHCYQLHTFYAAFFMKGTSLSN